MLVNFAGLSVLAQQSPQYSLPPHPHYFCRHTGFSSTLSFTSSSMSSLPFRGKEVSGSCSRMCNGGFYNNSSIFDEFSDVGAGVCVSNFVLLSGVKPDLALADASDGRCESLLRAKIDHSCGRSLWRFGNEGGG